MTVSRLFGVGFSQQIDGMDFDPSRSYRACLICGDVFQSELDRSELNDFRTELLAKNARDEWARVHAKRHSEKEHRQFADSGNSMTPEAANKLAAFGLLPIVDMVEDDEVKIALFESSPVPDDDVEGD